MIRQVVSHPLTRNFTAAKIQETASAFLLPGRYSQESMDSVEPGAIFLSDIPAEGRLSELEFYFPLQPISREKLTGLFREAGIAGHANRYTVEVSSGVEKVTDPGMFAESLKRLRFDPVRGFLKGFIDTVFRYEGRYYLIDWKSNFLGARKEDYHRDRLLTAMTEHDYILQYHLYVLALHRYLLFRQPGYDYRSHFGGVYYLFLRGMNPAWGADYGVYRDRPSAELVELLCREMIGA
jgi:exodeoxyribonuclease V beta subunit